MPPTPPIVEPPLSFLYFCSKDIDVEECHHYGEKITAIALFKVAYGNPVDSCFKYRKSTAGNQVETPLLVCMTSDQEGT